MKNSVFFRILCVFILTVFIQQSHAAKILSITFMAGRSHKITYDPLLDELAKRGHEVTVVSQVRSKSNSTNPKDILTFDIKDIMDRAPDMFEMKVRGEEMNPFAMVELFEDLCRDTYALPELEEVLNTKYDLVLHEPFFHECAAGFIHKLNTSTILITTISAPAELVRILGGPAPPSFIPNFQSPFDSRMNFMERLKNFIAELSMSLIKQFYFTPKMEALYRKALNDDSIPGYVEVMKNASMILSVSHMSLAGARPFMPDVVEVGGMHLHDAKPLPKVNTHIP